MRLMCGMQAALDRGNTTQTFATVDWLGLPPLPEHLPALAAALRELDARTGLAQIKAEVRQLVTTAQVNYERELEGEPPIEMSLNRLFVGNPGTGKLKTSIQRECTGIGDRAWALLYI